MYTVTTALAALLLLTAPVLAECGKASWYGTESGTRTASGERFTGQELTAAHRTLPLGSVLRVYDPKTGRSVSVRINDRGPARWTGRFLDLSRRAAESIPGLIAAGEKTVCTYRIC